MPSCWDLFFSYAHGDRAVAERIVRALRARGAAVWFDAAAMAPGATLSPALLAGIAASRAGVLLVGRDAGPWQVAEHAEMVRLGKPIIPIWYGPGPGATAFPGLTGILALRTSGRFTGELARRIVAACRAHAGPLYHDGTAALVLGAGGGGRHAMARLLDWRTVPVAGIYDKRWWATGIWHARLRGVPTFVARLDDLLALSEQTGRRGRRHIALVASVDASFCAWVRSLATGFPSVTFLWQGRDFPANASHEALHAPMR